MKGQAQIVGAIAVVVFVAVALITGAIVYGYVADVAPHDQVITNETICTTCVNNTLYPLANLPILNDTTLVCFNASADVLTNGVVGETCIGYNVVDNRNINITNTSSGMNCLIQDVVCTYTYDQANANEQSFFNDNTTNTYAGFAVASAIVIVGAAVALLGIVVLLRG